MRTNHQQSDDTRNRWLAWVVGLVLAISIADPVVVCAHPGFVGTAHATMDGEGNLRIFVKHDALAFALNDSSVNVDDEPMLELLRRSDEELADALRGAAERFRAEFIVRAGDREVHWEFAGSPTVLEVREWQLSRPTMPLPVKLTFELHATLPMTAGSFAIRLPAVLGDTIATVHRPGFEPLATPILAGEWSDTFDLLPPSRPMPREQAADTMAALTVGPAQTSPALPGTDQPATTFFRTMVRFIGLGLKHIVPLGPDHILFVLGLFLVSRSGRMLLWQVTAFTLAHSATLVFASIGWVHAPARLIEPIIAASIATVAIEAAFCPSPRRSSGTKIRRESTQAVTDSLRTRDLARLVLVFVFGLVHGLGFAGVLGEFGLPSRHLLPALLSFNIGIELGQLAVVGCAWALVGWGRHRRWYRPAVVVPASIAIAAIGVWWTLQRSLGM